MMDNSRRVDVDSKAWLERQLKPYPPRIKAKIREGWAKRRYSESAKNPIRSANIYARTAVKHLEAIRAKYPFRSMGQLYRREKLEALANDCAFSCMAIVSAMDASRSDEENYQEAYHRLAMFTAKRGVTPPMVPACLSEMDDPVPWLESALARMVCGDWWLGRLQSLRDQCVEHIQLAAGLVSRKQPYISDASFKEWEASQRKQADWLENTEIESEDGTVLKLADVASSGIANPEHRRIELMIRIRGLEDEAKDAGRAAYFLTFTTPSRFHPSSRKWDGCSPREGQQWLRKTWELIRSKLDRHGIEFSGVRVAEPHKDGCPHWHMLVFVDEKHSGSLLKVCKAYALRTEATEAGAEQRRFTGEYIDPPKGSATGYIAKYISKNINAAHMDGSIDYETQKKTSDTCDRVRSWASRWRIRQFQFFGTAPITLYRELRRLREQITNCEIETARQAADSARWVDFVKAAGALTLEKQVTPSAGQYNDFVESVIGIRAGEFVVCTRPVRWRLKKGGSPSPWSTGNNCTHPASAAVPPHLSSAVQALGLEPEAAHHLLAGSGVFRDTGESIYRIRENELKEYPY